MIATRERLTARTGVPRDAVPPLARRAGSGKCLDLRGGRGTTPRLLPGGEPPNLAPFTTAPKKAGGYRRRAPEVDVTGLRGAREL